MARSFRMTPPLTAAKDSSVKKQNLLDLARDESGKDINALLKSLGPLQPDGIDNPPTPDR
jgi:hypothetical protein